MNIRRSLAAMSVITLLLSVTAEAQEGAAVGELVTDRPDFTESSRVVGAGITQIEMGTMMELGASDGSRTLTTPLALMRVGVSRRLELRLSSDGFVNAYATGVGGPARGTSDVEVGAKVVLRDDSQGGVAFAIIPMLSLPTGAAAVSSGTVDPQVKLTWATALPSSFDLSGNVNFSRLSDAAGRYTEQAVSASLAHDLRGGWAGYWEVFGFMGSRQDYAPSWTVNTGVTHAVGRNAQIDVEIGRGISPAAPDWFVGAGVALRTAGVGRPR